VRIRDMGREGRPMIQVGAEPVVFIELPPRCTSDRDVEVIPIEASDDLPLPAPVGVAAPAESEPAVEGEPAVDGEPVKRSRRSKR
jgi:hypothetical protein